MVSRYRQKISARYLGNSGLTRVDGQKSTLDILTGSSKHDTLKAKKSASILYGKKGNDMLIGSNENDVLLGGKGNDTLKGNAGSDTFILSQGQDRIIDLQPQEGDSVVISPTINYEVINAKDGANIVHADGIAFVEGIDTSELLSVIATDY